MDENEPKRRRVSKKVKPAPSQGGRGGLTQKVRTAKGRKLSSTRWLERQLNDPYVALAKERGYRSRAALKLEQIDDKFGILKGGHTYVDLGAAPGGWCQVIAERVLSTDRAKTSKVVAVDLLATDPIPGVDFLQLDFMEPGAEERILNVLGDQADCVLSDMAAPATGHKQTDHLRIIALCEAAYEFAKTVLRPGGSFVAKVLQGGAEDDLLNDLKKRFQSVRHVKPAASRADSAEMYVVATGFRP